MKTLKHMERSVTPTYGQDTQWKWHCIHIESVCLHITELLVESFGFST